MNIVHYHSLKDSSYASFPIVSLGHSMSSSRHSLTSTGHPDVASPKYDVMSASDHSAQSVPQSPGQCLSYSSEYYTNAGYLVCGYYHAHYDFSKS